MNNQPPKINGLPLGVSARGSFAKETTFRIQRGRQDTYDYTVSPNPRTVAQQENRGRLRLAMWAWADLSPAQKEELEDLAHRHPYPSGFHAHMSLYLKGYAAWYNDL